jgi:excisionase family DNA binding protein
MQTLEKELGDIKLLLQLNKPLLNVEEVCLLLGISRNYLYRLTSTGKIKFYRPFGKLMYFDREELVQSLKQNPIKPRSEIMDKATNYLFTSKSKKQ